MNVVALRPTVSVRIAAAPEVSHGSSHQRQRHCHHVVRVIATM
jgi:hypothetical protein